MTADNDNAMNITDATPVTPQKPDASSANIFVRFWQAITHFLHEVTVELKKTNWPTRNELTKFVIVVMFTIVIVSIFLFISDTVLSFLAGKLFNISAR